MRVGICGSSASGSEPIAKKAARLGILLAERRHEVVTGGGDGLPYTVAHSAFSHGGRTVGFSPGHDLEEHEKRFGFPSDAFTEFRFRPKEFEFADINMACLKLRNVSMISYSEAVIFLKGKTGTLNEFTIALDMGKPIGAITGSGGVADHIPKLVELCDKPMGSVLVLSDEPDDLVKRLEAVAARAR